MHLLGALYAKMGRDADAVEWIRKAIAIQPYNVAALDDLGAALLGIHALDEAEDVYRRVLALKGASAPAHFNVAMTLQRKGIIGEAVALLRKALALDPNFLQAAFALAGSLSEMGQEDEGLALFHKAAAGRPQDAFVNSNLLFALLYNSKADEPTIYQEHLRWATRHAEPLARLIQPHPNSRQPDRTLRVGYVSGDFWEHAVSFFFEGLLAAHDPAQVEVFCYADVLRSDAVTERLRAKSLHWRDIARRTDEEVARMVRDDQIDILVDLAGHSTGNRLQLFARKPAPVQVTYVGYPHTTGMQAMDYRIVDALTDPPGQGDEFHTERLVRLNRPFLCYRPTGDAPPVNALPADTAGHITFCSFNALAKIRQPTVELWARVLSAVPGSRMLIKAPRLQDDAPRDVMRAWFAAAGISADRIEFAAGTKGFLEHLAVYHRADIGLDTFPYHGTTTTCEAMWMGLPVVTRAGHAHRSRVGVSLLTSVGLSDLITQTPEQFVATAAALANDRDRLRSLRATFRDRMANSELLDCAGLARAIETAYRTMWRAWCYMAQT
jgi:predicted O-linked N-acetylglucosamine transferase (SPINDLY family)